MTFASELRAQVEYQQKLTRQLGAAGGFEARARGWLLRLGVSEMLRLHPPCVAHPVFVRANSTDPDTYHQILVQREYGVLADLDPEVIVDCGANAGYTSAFLLTMFPRARVIAIEPFPANAEMCRRNLAPYGQRAEVRCAAVWSHTCRLVLEGCAGNEWGVQVREARPGETGDVDAMGLVDLGLPQIDLLKVDIEGSETALFRHDADAWLPRVGAIAIELHGPDCEAAFDAALSQYPHSRQLSGELVIVRRLQR